MGVTLWPVEDKPGLGRKSLHMGKNSGYQAINFAYLMGATRIILLGYDMQGGSHFFGRHPKELRQQPDFKRHTAAFRTIHPDEYGIEIYNCTRETALDAFPVVPLEEVCEDILGAQALSAPL